MQQSDTITDLVTAINGAQLAMKPAVKDHVNPFHNSKYADLVSCWEALATFREWGITITQSPAEAPPGHIAIVTQLSHTPSGQWMRGEKLVLPLAQQTPQGVGSALSYGRRYSLSCLTGLVTELDDDGNAASGLGSPALAKSIAKPEMTPKPPASRAPLPSIDGPLPPTTAFAFGKHKGSALSDPAVPSAYLQWLFDSTTAKINFPDRQGFRVNDEALLAGLRLELDRRATGPVLFKEEA